MRFRATASEIFSDFKSDFKFSFWLFVLFKLKFDATFHNSLKTLDTSVFGFLSLQFLSLCFWSNTDGV